VKGWIVTVAVLLGVVFAGLASARTFTGPVPPVEGTPPVKSGEGAKALLSSAAAGATSALTLQLHGELQCGRLQARGFVVHLPAAMDVPSAIARARVKLGGRIPLHVLVKANSVSLTMPLRPAVLCSSLTQGWFSIAFARTAGLRNPATPGSYGFDVSGLPGGRWSGTLTVR
jgi:hypothetical protein